MKTILNIEGMSCQHCVASVTETISKLSGVTSVVVSLENKNATIEHDDSIREDQFKEEIENIGFDVV